MKKNTNPTYRSKAENLETRAQLDNQPIPITVLEQIFFSLDGVQAREAIYKNTFPDNRHPMRNTLKQQIQPKHVIQQFSPRNKHSCCYAK